MCLVNLNARLKQLTIPTIFSLAPRSTIKAPLKEKKNRIQHRFESRTISTNHPQRPYISTNLKRSSRKEHSPVCTREVTARKGFLASVNFAGAICLVIARNYEILAESFYPSSESFRYLASQRVWLERREKEKSTTVRSSTSHRSPFPMQTPYCCCSRFACNY